MVSLKVGTAPSHRLGNYLYVLMFPTALRSTRTGKSVFTSPAKGPADTVACAEASYLGRPLNCKVVEFKVPSHLVPQRLPHPKVGKVSIAKTEQVSGIGIRCLSR